MKAFSLIVLFFCGSLWADVSVIAVTGEAEKSVDPNMVHIQIELWAKSTQAKMAQEAVAKEYQRVKTTIEKFKIKKEDFQTSSYTLVPEYNYDKGTARIVGHRASHTMLIILRKTEDTGSVIDTLSSGTVSIQSVAWDYDKRAQVEMSLLAEAVKSAKDQADELAKASGSKIKKVHRLSNAASGMPIPMARSAKMGMVNELAMASTEMAAGPVKIKVQVAAEYELQ